MLTTQQIQQLSIDAIPFNKVLDLSCTAANVDSVTVSMPDHASRHNHLAGPHAAAQFGLAEATSGAMLINAFNDLLVAGYTPLATEATIRYQKFATGDLLAIGHLAESTQAETRSLIAERDKARFTIDVTLQMQDGTEVTKVDVEWILLKRRK